MLFTTCGNKLQIILHPDKSVMCWIMYTFYKPQPQMESIKQTKWNKPAIYIHCQTVKWHSVAKRNIELRLRRKWVKYQSKSSQTLLESYFRTLIWVQWRIQFYFLLCAIKNKQYFSCLLWLFDFNDCFNYVSYITNEHKHWLAANSLLNTSKFAEDNVPT